MSGVGLVAVAFCGGYTVRFGPKDPFAICSLSYGALEYSMTHVSLRAFERALGTQKRLTTAGGTHVSETPA